MSVVVAAATGVRASAQPGEQHTSRPAAPLVANRRQLIKAGLTAGLCLCCPLPLAALAGEAAAPAAAASAPAATGPTILSRAQEVATVADGVGLPPWGYSCLDGPVTWGGVCSTVGAQSPIDLDYDARFPPAPDSTLRVLSPRFPRFIKSGATVKNTGHGTMQVNVPDGIEYELVPGGQRHRLLQFHFHTPSEHTVDGANLAMEAHLVHRNMETGGLAVLGVFIQGGGDLLPNPCIKEALASAPLAPGAETPLQRPINLQTLLPKARTADGMRPYAHYSGSLTTPPCSTGVDWYVFLDPLQVDPDQVVDFMFYAGKGRRPGVNARPAQPLGDRSVTYFM